MKETNSRISRTGGGALKFVLALTLALGMAPAMPTAFASEEAATDAGAPSVSTGSSESVVELGEGTTRIGLMDALQGANGGTVRLTADLSFDEFGASITLNNANATLDLNGHTITFGESILSIKVQKTSAITIVDNSEEGGGSIVQSGSTADSMVIDCVGTLTIEGGTVSGPNAAVKANGESARFTMTGGELRGGDTALIGTDGAEAAIKGGSVTSTGANGTAVRLEGAEATVSGNSVLKGVYGVVLFNSDENEEGTAHSDLTVDGGSIEATYFAISGNNKKLAGCSATISSGTVSSSDEAAIYWPMEGELAIAGGSLSGATVVEAKMGTIEISGGTLTATGAKSSANIGGGSISDGSVVKVVGQSYGSSEGQYIDNPDLSVSITGGILVSTRGNAVTVYNDGAEVDFDGGKLECSVSVSDSATLTPAQDSDAVRVVSKVPGFAVDQTEDTVSNGNTTIKSSVLSDSAVLVTTNTVSTADETETAETTTLCSGIGRALSEAAGVDGPTVTLLRDVSEDVTVPEGAGVTIDFNSHTLTGTVDNQGELTFAGRGGLVGQVTGNEASTDEDAAVTTVVAQIGEDAYPTLEKALENAESGDTVVLLGDAFCGALTVPAGVTIDGQRNRIVMVGDAAGSSSFITVSEDGVKIMNAVVEAGSSVNHGIQFYLAGGGTLDNVSISGGKGTSLMVNGSDVTVKDCAFAPGEGAWANIEYAMGKDVTRVPTLSVEGTNGYKKGIPFVYVDVREGETLDRIKENVAELKDARASDVAEWLNENRLKGVYLQVGTSGSMGAAAPGEKPEPPVTPPAKPSYDVAVGQTENGSVSVDPKAAKKGDEVTVTVKPDEGFELESLVVTDEDGNQLKLTANTDGTYSFEMPDGDVTVAATFVCDGGELCPSHGFSDVDQSQWYHAAIDWAVEAKVLNGIDGTTLMMPDAEITRAQMAQVLWNVEGNEPAASEAAFSDVDPGEWYVGAISWAVESGVFEGYAGTGLFGPDEPLTREQAALVLQRWSELNGEDVSGRADLSGYPDAELVSDWALDGVSWAVSAGILKGVDQEDGTALLDPAGTATRAQVAALMMRLEGQRTA